MENFWVPLVLALLVILSGLLTVSQGTVAVITMFGKYRRVLHPGLRIKIPFIEKVYKRVSIQNQSIEMEFQAVTIDQANVYFKSMLLYSVMDEQDETIKKVAFKFISNKDFMQALVRTIEGSIRAYVASQKQSEILGLRHELVHSVKEQIDHT
ncbi:MAG: SPFH domain-containing protein, partial [Bacteroidota bacterium]